MTTPTVVAYTQMQDENGCRPVRLVGKEALEQAQDNQENTFSSIRRILGRSFYDSKIKPELEKSRVKIVPGLRGRTLLCTNLDVLKQRQYKFYPEEVMAIIIQKLKADADAFLSFQVDDVSIATPCYYNSN